MQYVVVRDTREQEGEGWWWPASKYCAGTVRDTLPTGDYTLRGYEEMLIIERKGSISEWAKNINEARVERELERMESIRFPFILLEFNMVDIINYPIGSGIPKFKWGKLRFKGPYFLKRTIEFMTKYRTKIVFCGGSGKEIASSIFKRTIEIIENVKDLNSPQPERQTPSA